MHRVSVKEVTAVSWQAQLKGDSLSWLLEPDSPGARYLALRDVVGADEAGAELRTSRCAGPRDGPIAAVLSQMDPAGQSRPAAPASASAPLGGPGDAQICRARL